MHAVKISWINITSCKKYNLSRFDVFCSFFDVKCPRFVPSFPASRRDALNLPQDVIPPAPAKPCSSRGRLQRWKPRFQWDSTTKDPRLNVGTPSPSLIITISPDVYKSFRHRLTVTLTPYQFISGILLYIM